MNKIVKLDATEDNSTSISLLVNTYNCFVYNRLMNKIGNVVRTKLRK